MTTLGAVFRPQLPPERLSAVARAADDAGLEELWLWEDCFLESGIAAASAALALTSRLRVGIGVLPVPLRNVALTAMEIATMERMFPGRLEVGIGHGVQAWMAQVGRRIASPLTMLREQSVALQRLLAGEEVTTEGRYVTLDHVRLGWPPATAPRILHAATGPKSLRLSGEIADGTVLTGGTTPYGVCSARELIRAGQAEPGRETPHTITVYLLAATGPDAADRVTREQEPWALPDSDTAVLGDAQAIADGIARWTQAGVDRVVLQPTADEPDPEGFVRFVAEQVRPLVP